MSFLPVSDNLTLSTKIVEQVKEAIAQGRYAPGDKLPPEREWAEIFKVSRTVVRDAMKTLAGTGIITVRQGVGAIVTEGASDAVGHRLVPSALGRKSAIRHLFEIRKVLEAEGAAWAAMRCTQEELEELQQVLAQGLQSAESEPYDPGSHESWNRLFHDTLARISKNDLLPEVLENVRKLLEERRRGKLVDREWARRSMAEHARIVAAIRSRDPEAARWAVKQHLGDVEETEVARISADENGAG